MPSRSLLPLILLLVFALAGAGHAQPAASAALVAAVKGTGRTLTLPTGGGKLQAATRARLTTGSSLSSGAFVQLAAGATATLYYYADGHREDLTGPCVIRVGGAGGHLLKGDASAIKLSDSEVGEALRPPESEPDRVAVSAGTTLGVSSQNGMPVFSWQTSAAGPYLVSVTQPGGSGPANLWGSEVGGSSASYDGPQLNLDTPYVWQLSAAGQPLGAMRFEIPSHGAIQSLGKARAEAAAAPDDPATRTAWAVVQDQRGNLPQATSLAQAVLANNSPNESQFMNRLGGMFQEMGQEAQARAISGQAQLYEDEAAPMIDPDMDDYLESLDYPYLP